MARIERQEVSNKVHIHCLILITIQWFVRCMKPIASMWQLWGKVIAPPTGSRKCVIFKCFEFTILLLPNLLQTSSEYCKNMADVKLWREYWYLKYCCHGTCQTSIFFFWWFWGYPGIFGGLNMVKNSWKFAHTLEPVAVRMPLRLGPGRGTEALRRPLEHIRKLDV